MDEFDNTPQLPGDDSALDNPISLMRSLARRGRRRIKGAVRRQIEQLGQRVTEELTQLLSSPRQVERIQSVLVNLANWSMQKGFRSDPNAELLFEFVDWLEDRHPRQKVTAILMRSPVLLDPEFLEALAHLARAANPWVDDPADEPRWDQQRLRTFKKRAGNRLLGLLVELAALEHEQPPPSSEGAEQKIEYFESAPIPVRFQRLGAMTQGDKLMQRRSSPSPPKLIQKLTRRLPGANRRDNELRRWIPGLGDDTLYFLVFSTGFFFQSYLLRNMIEAFPQLADELSRQVRDGEMIDVE